MVDYNLGLDGFLSPASLPCAPTMTPVAVILLLPGSSQGDQRSVQSVCRLQIDCTEQGTVGEGLARVRGPHRVPGSQAKPPSVAEARCCPLVIIPRRLSYHRRWALAPSASASLLLVLVQDSWFWFWFWALALALVFSSLPLSATTTGPDIPRLRRQHSLPGAHSMHGIGPPASCMPFSVALVLSICSRPAQLPTHPYPYQ